MGDAFRPEPNQSECRRPAVSLTETWDSTFNRPNLPNEPPQSGTVELESGDGSANCLAEANAVQIPPAVTLRDEWNVREVMRIPVSRG